MSLQPFSSPLVSRIDEHDSRATAAARLPAEASIVPLLTNRLSRQLLQDVGGFDTILRITLIFYEKFAKDQHLRPFLGELHYPLEVHAKRLALYITEMMGDSSMPWSNDLKSCPFRQTKVKLGTGETVLVKARSEAHYAAWNSTKRRPDQLGRRFKLDDCRVWMRLFFWSSHELGIPSAHPQLFDYLVRWVGHFIRIYESTAQQFTRLESRWATSEANLAAYVDAGCFMKDVVGVPLSQCVRLVPQVEVLDAKWPYVGDQRIPFEE